MRVLEIVLLVVGLACIGLYVFFTVQADMRQAELERALEDQLRTPETGESATPPRKLSEGDLVGKLEIPRLNVSVMVMEGIEDSTLRLGAGHIPGTSFPGASGNVGIAAHRDTFFREIRNIKASDVIRFTTPRGTVAYRVATTKIVPPSDVQVLEPTTEETITLVTCYPFYYIGPAPKRFVVQATRDRSDARSLESKSFELD